MMFRAPAPVQHHDFYIHVTEPTSTWNGKFGTGLVLMVNYDRDSGSWLIPQRGDKVTDFLPAWRLILGDTEADRLETYLREKGLL